MSKAPFPRIRIQGCPYERGHQYGRQAAALIRHSLAAYHMIFGYYNGWSWQNVRQHAKSYLPIIGSYRPHLLDEMQGIADGADLLLADILALNIRTEILNAVMASKAYHECTAFLIIPEKDSVMPIFLGQNWDWKPVTAKAVILLEVAPDQGPNFISVVEAGLLAKMGMNAAGIGLVTNALLTDLDKDQPDIPYHIILRAILEEATLDQAIESVRGAARASAANYLVASQDGRVVNLEAAPSRKAVNLYQQSPNSIYVHTNHFLCKPLSFVDVGLQQGPDSPIREQRMHNFLIQMGDAPTPEKLQAALSDHYNYPYSICCHPDEERPPAEQYASIASLIMDLSTRRIWLTGDYPCQATYQLLDYGDFLAA